MDARPLISDSMQPVSERLELNGRYTDIQQVAATASSRIYRARRAGKMMLIKTPADDSAMRLALLQREYEVGIPLDHPNIVGIYTWEAETPVGPGIIMEYINGRTLDVYLAERPTLEARRRVLAQLLDAVDYMHRHGLLHNDLKPTNILVSHSNNDVKIIDFGLSDNDAQAVQRMMGGTVGYASPELESRDPRTDTRSDIYSLGIIIRDMFGRRYHSIWKRCTAANPERRYRNVGQLQRALRRRRRRPFVVATVAVVAIVALAVIVMTRQTGTISTLRQQQQAARDSMARLNAALSAIDASQARQDSLREAYTQAYNQLTDKYVARLGALRCMEESLPLLEEYNKEIDEMNESFISSNMPEGNGIVQQLGATLYLQSHAAVNTAFGRLPLLGTQSAPSAE